MAAHRPFKVTRPRSFHLLKSKLHQPITNLAGNGAAGTRVDFDAAKVAAEGSEPPYPEASPEDQAAAAQYDHSTTGVPQSGGLVSQLATDAASGLLPTAGAGGSRLAQILKGVWTGTRGGLEGGTAGLSGALAAKPTLDPSLTGEQLSAQDQAPDLRTTSARVQANVDPARTQELTNNAGNALQSGIQSTIRGMPLMGAGASLWNMWRSRHKATLADQAHAAADAAYTYAGARGLGNKLMQNLSAQPTPAVEGPAALSAQEPSKAAQFARGALQRFTSPYRALAAPAAPVGTPLAAPEAPASSALGRMAQRAKSLPGLRTSLPALRPMTAEASRAAQAAGPLGKVAPWLRTGGRVLGRLGAFGAIANTVSNVSNAYHQSATDEGKQEYADQVQAQTEADQGRSGLDKVQDTGKALGSLALGDPQHASSILAEHAANIDSGYGDAVAADAGARDVMNQNYGSHNAAMQSYFPGLSGDSVAKLTHAGTQHSADDYRLFQMAGKPYPVGISSFEKRLNDPQGPYAQLPANQRAIYRDLGRRLGGSKAESLLSDPEWSKFLDPAAKVQQYSSPHVSYAPTDAPAPPAAPPVRPGPAQPANPTPAPAAPPHPTAGAPGMTGRPGAQRPTPPPKINVPPPTPPSPGTAPIGQAFSPLRGTMKAALAKFAGQAPGAPAAPPAPAMPKAPAAVPPAAPAMPAPAAATPPPTPAMPAAPAAAPKPVSTPKPRTLADHGLGSPAAAPGYQPQQAAPTPAAAPAPVTADEDMPSSAIGDTAARAAAAGEAYQATPQERGLAPEAPAQPVPATPMPAPAAPAAAPGYHPSNPTPIFDWHKGIGSNGIPTTPEAQSQFVQQYQQGLESDAKVTPAIAQQQMAAREKELIGLVPGSKLMPGTMASNAMRAGMAKRFGDPAMADPKLPFKDFEAKMVDHAATDSAKKIQAQFDAVKPESAGDMVKNNWQLALIPIGIMMALSSKSNMGKIMGLLMAVGGGANVYGRYAALKSPEFAAYLQKKTAGQTTAADDAKFAKTFQDAAWANQHGMLPLPAILKEKAAALVRNGQAGRAMPEPAAPAPQPAPAPAAAPAPPVAK
jgi:hypothetical protein